MTGGARGAGTASDDRSGTPPTDRVRVRRLAERGRYDRTTVEAILDEGYVCHVGLAGETGPMVIPTAYGRDGNELYLHGAPANATLRGASTGVEICVTVTLVDGLVLARSAFHHSINYRSVVIVGRAAEVTGTEEKRRALSVVVDHIVPGRSVDARAPTDNELRATRVLRLPLDEASAKIRTGGPKDDPEDMDLAVWAGVLPLRTAAGPPLADTGRPASMEAPDYLVDYIRPTHRSAMGDDGV